MEREEVVAASGRVVTLIKVLIFVREIIFEIII